LRESSKGSARLGSRLEAFLATPELPAGRAGVPSPGELRCLPMIARGVAGAQPGSNPVGALLAKERRRR
jgi:hypothetical protein